MSDEASRIRNAVRLGYDLRAPGFGRSQPRRPRSRPVPAPEVPSGGLALDVGCGAGASMQPLLEQRTAHLIVGLDLSTGMLRRARQELAGERTVRLLQADAERLPFPAAAFDVIVSRRCLSHLPDQCLAFRQIARLLRPDGVADVTLIGDRALGRPVERLMRSALGEVLGARAQAFIDLFRPPTIGAVDAAAHAAGLLASGLTDATTHRWHDADQLVDALLAATAYIQAQLSPHEADRVAASLRAKAKDAAGPRGLEDWSYEIHYVGRKPAA